LSGFWSAVFADKGCFYRSGLVVNVGLVVLFGGGGRFGLRKNSLRQALLTCSTGRGVRLRGLNHSVTMVRPFGYYARNLYNR
jgi:hypothetical protein